MPSEGKFKDVSRAYLKKVKLKSIGTYKCDAEIQEVSIFSNEFILGDKIRIIFFLKNTNLITNIARIHGTFQSGHYFITAVDILMEFGEIWLKSQWVLFNTKSNDILIKNGYFGQFREFSFTSPDDLIIHDFNFRTTNLFVQNRDWKIQIELAKINYLFNGTIHKITAKNADYTLTIDQISIKNKIARFSKVIFKKADITAIAETAITADFNNILFEKGIRISNSKINLYAKKAQKIGEKIKLEEIEYVALKNVQGYSKIGYFDIKNRKLVLVNGKIKSSF